MTQQQRLTLLVQAFGADIKAIFTKEGNLANLTTTDKTSLVNAINEIKNAVASASGINDTTASSSSTYSSTKIEARIVAVSNAAITALVNGAPAALDTLKELADQLAADESITAGLLTQIGNRVRFDSDQSTVLTTAQKAIARLNIDAFGSQELGNPDTDLVALYNTAKS